MALDLRKELKDNGQIISGYIDFPAKLMVNNGEVDSHNPNRKIYKLHKNFSEVEVTWENSDH